MPSEQQTSLGDTWTHLDALWVNLCTESAAADEEIDGWLGMVDSGRVFVEEAFGPLRQATQRANRVQQKMLKLLDVLDSEAWIVTEVSRLDPNDALDPA